MKSKSTPKQSESPGQPLTLKSIEDLNWDMQQVQLAIARRAYELFEQRGCEHGHAWEDWFRAESELLRPVSVVISESDDRMSVRANVFGFEEKELSVAVEPRRVAILGKKQVSVTESEGGKIEYIDWSPDLIMKYVTLATDVMPESARVELLAGVLKFELLKAARQSTERVAPAA